MQDQPVSTPAPSAPAPGDESVLTQTGAPVTTPQARTTMLVDGKQFAGKAVSWAEDYAPSVIGVIILLSVAWAGAGLVRRGIRRGLVRARFDPTLGKFLSNMARWLVIALAVMACLEVFGVKTTGFAALIGAAGLAVGLGFQGSLSNLAAGVMLLVFRPFKVGDFVVVGGQSGTVNEIDLFTTNLDTPDGRRIVMPNGQIFGTTIENITYHPRRRADVTVGVGYEADIDTTRRALERAAAAAQGGLRDPEPGVALLALGASSVEWMVQVWAPAGDFGAVKQSLVRAVKAELDRAAIPIACPQVEVHLKGGAPDGIIRVLPREGAGRP
jgi:small conductance mechanosensitive channel